MTTCAPNSLEECTIGESELSASTAGASQSAAGEVNYAVPTCNGRNGSSIALATGGDVLSEQ